MRSADLRTATPSSTRVATVNDSSIAHFTSQRSSANAVFAYLRSAELQRDEDGDRKGVRVYYMAWAFQVQTRRHITIKLSTTRPNAVVLTCVGGCLVV
jgi:hypothetical protein